MAGLRIVVLSLKCPIAQTSQADRIATS